MAEKPPQNADSSVSSVHRRSPVFRVRKPFLNYSMPHFNSMSNYLTKPELTDILKGLITASSLPLKAVETDFAVDSSGFSTLRFVR